MKTKKRASNYHRGVSPIIAVVLLLLMTVAAGGAAYLWMTKLQSMMTESVTGQFLQSTRAQETKFCIESIWNDTAAIKFTLRNCGSYDVTASDFANTGYYIDNVKADGCSATGTGSFNVYDIRTVTCSTTSYGCCTDGGLSGGLCIGQYKGCPTRTVRATTVFGRADTVIYQYRPS